MQSLSFADPQSTDITRDFSRKQEPDYDVVKIFLLQWQNRVLMMKLTTHQKLAHNVKIFTLVSGGYLPPTMDTFLAHTAALLEEFCEFIVATMNVVLADIYNLHLHAESDAESDQNLMQSDDSVEVLIEDKSPVELHVEVGAESSGGSEDKSPVEKHGSEDKSHSELHVEVGAESSGGSEDKSRVELRAQFGVESDSHVELRAECDVSDDGAEVRIENKSPDLTKFRPEHDKSHDAKKSDDVDEVDLLRETAEQLTMSDKLQPVRAEEMQKEILLLPCYAKRQSSASIGCVNRFASLTDESCPEDDDMEQEQQPIIMALPIIADQEEKKNKKKKKKKKKKYVRSVCQEKTAELDKETESKRMLLLLYRLCCESPGLVEAVTNLYHTVLAIQKVSPKDRMPGITERFEMIIPRLPETKELSLLRLEPLSMSALEKFVCLLRDTRGVLVQGYLLFLEHFVNDASGTLLTHENAVRLLVGTVRWKTTLEKFEDVVVPKLFLLRSTMQDMLRTPRRQGKRNHLPQLLESWNRKKGQHCALFKCACDSDFCSVKLVVSLATEVFCKKQTWDRDGAEDTIWNRHVVATK